MSSDPPAGDDPVAQEVEEQAASVGDPEGSPANPSATIAATAAPLEDAAASAAPGTSAEILQLAWPVMLSMTLASVIGLVDVAMVGRLGADAQAAVGVAQQIFFVAQSALFALSFACVALMARAIGGNDVERARRSMAASVVLAIGVAFVLFLALGVDPGPLLVWLEASPEVVELCVPYMRLVMGSTLLTAVGLMIESGLRADKDTVTPMIVTAVLTVVKIGLNGVFMFGWLGGPIWGVTGAGVATLVSQLVAAVIFVGLTIARDRDDPTALRLRDFRDLGDLMRPLVRIAAPSILERLVMNLAMISYFKFIGGYGTAAIAAYTIGIRILSFTWIPGTGYSQAVATLIGQALGAGDEARAERVGWRAARLAIVTAVVTGAAAAIFREPLAMAFTVDADTAAALVPFMLCLALAQPAMQLHFTLAGAFRGAGDTTTPFWAAMVGNWVFRVPLALLFARVLEWPLVSIWMVLILDHLSRAIWLLLGFRRGSWKRKLEEKDGR